MSRAPRDRRLRRDDDSSVEHALRAGLEEYELSDEDRVACSRRAAEDGATRRRPARCPCWPSSVGPTSASRRWSTASSAGARPSSRTCPGVTRDRVAYEATGPAAGSPWSTPAAGSATPRASTLRVAEQAEIAVDLADAVLFVVDATVGATDTDEAVVRVLRRAGKPVILAANKVDDLRAEADAATLWSLGLGEPYPVSALHGRAAATCSTPCSRCCRTVTRGRRGRTPSGGPRRVALLGRPNVGKSSLLNKLAGEDRVVVDAVAGTTRDPVDELVELGGRHVAVRRHRRHPAPGAPDPRRRLLRLAAHPGRAGEGRGRGRADRRPRPRSPSRTCGSCSEVIDAGRALVIAYNKWDLLDEERRYYLEREIERELVQVPWAPRVNISARTGRHLDRLVPALDAALDVLGHAGSRPAG